MFSHISTRSGDAKGRQGQDARVISECQRLARAISTGSCRTRPSRNAGEAVSPQPALAAPAWVWQAGTQEATL